MSPPPDPKDLERTREAAARLRAAEGSVRILRTLAWEPEVKQRFFERRCDALPEVEYPTFDAGPVLEQVDAVRPLLEGEGPVDRWLQRSADHVARAARLLESVGTPAFLEHGAHLYGLPAEGPEGATPLELARTFDDLCQEIGGGYLGELPRATHTAEDLARELERVCRERFGDEAPRVEVVDHLSANALAEVERVRVRRGARFTDREVQQLVQHEAFVHVCTSLNGRAQEDLPLLAASHAGTTRTQEGLAVFAEFITGCLGPNRLRRLADRTLAIQMAIEGADFVQVFRSFLEHGATEDEAYESARRVFRGGVLTGGAPFTKDSVYLNGFLSVTNCLRSIVSQGRTDLLLLLFCGKLDVDDLPALAQLAAAGLCRPPRHLPPWVEDRRYLVTYLTYSSFLNRVDMHAYRTHHARVLADAPRLAGWGVPPGTAPGTVAGTTPGA